MPNLTLSTRGGIATLTFNREGANANLLDRATLVELSEKLGEIDQVPTIKGLIICSAKPTIFIAGADLNVLSTSTTEELTDLIELGQRTFTQLADLHIPTVAAIHGACLGGGLELALACNWRIASDSSQTKLGLPETQLGILPAWGGTTRLPALIGLPAALALILPGKIIPARAALRKGLIDAVAPAEHLQEFAHDFLKRGKRRPKLRPLLHHRLSAMLIHHQARKALLKKTRGLYPAPEAALDVATASVTSKTNVSLHRERDAILRLTTLPQTQQLLRLFFLQERAKKHNPVTATPRRIESAAVIGAGIMGSGIAYWLSTRRIPVILQDLSEDAVARGMRTISRLYDEAVSNRIVTRVEAARGLDRIHPATGTVPLHRCQLVIEAATEDLAIKKQIFAELVRRTATDAILATNTSALPIHDLAEVVSYPERLLGLHFFNPVHRMQLVEVVRTTATSDATLATGIAFVRAIGKLPVVVRDAPGFLVNRILMPYLVEAAHLMETGTPPKAIDHAMLGFGMPMGPLRLLDEVGLDVALHVAGTLAAAFPDRMAIPTIVEKLVAEGHLGRKSGAGIYRYQNGQPAPNPAALALCANHSHTPHHLGDHLARLMTMEARRCLDDGVVASADDIDLAMILGTGYPPFRGGPMQYAPLSS